MIYIMVWMVFIGSVLVTWDGHHLKMDFFSIMLPSPAKEIMNFLGAVAFVAACLFRPAASPYGDQPDERPRPAQRRCGDPDGGPAFSPCCSASPSCSLRWSTGSAVWSPAILRARSMSWSPLPRRRTARAERRQDRRIGRSQMRAQLSGR